MRQIHRVRYLSEGQERRVNSIVLAKFNRRGGLKRRCEISKEETVASRERIGFWHERMRLTVPPMHCVRSRDPCRSLRAEGKRERKALNFQRDTRGQEICFKWR